MIACEFSHGLHEFYTRQLQGGLRSFVDALADDEVAPEAVIGTRPWLNPTQKTSTTTSDEGRLGTAACATIFFAQRQPQP
jgi:hypothetical protein